MARGAPPTGGSGAQLSGPDDLQLGQAWCPWPTIQSRLLHTADNMKMSSVKLPPCPVSLEVAFGTEKSVVRE